MSSCSLTNSEIKSFSQIEDPISSTQWERLESYIRSLDTSSTLTGANLVSSGNTQTQSINGLNVGTFYTSITTNETNLSAVEADITSLSNDVSNYPIADLSGLTAGNVTTLQSLDQGMSTSDTPEFLQLTVNDIDIPALTVQETPLMTANVFVPTISNEVNCTATNDLTVITNLTNPYNITIVFNIDVTTTSSSQSTCSFDIDFTDTSGFSSSYEFVEFGYTNAESVYAVQLATVVKTGDNYNFEFDIPGSFTDTSICHGVIVLAV